MAIIEGSYSEFLVAVAVIFVVILVIKRWNSTKRLPPGTRYPKCLPSVPLLGSLPFLPLKFAEFPEHFLRQSKKYGSVFGVYLGTKYSVILNDDESIKEAFMKKSIHFSDRDQGVAGEAMSVNGKGIAFLNYTETFRHRRILYMSILKQFGYGNRSMEMKINAEVEEMVNQIRLLGGKSYDSHEIIETCIMSVVASMLFGRRYPYGHPALNELATYVYQLHLNLPQAAEMLPLLRFIPPVSGQYKKIVELTSNSRIFLDREVNAAIKDAVENQGDSFVRKFVELTATDADKRSLSDVSFDREELFQIVREFLIGGTDTSSTTLQWTLFFLANNPKEQARAQKEIDDVVGRDRLCSLDDEANLPYTQALILEIMRRRTVGPLSMFHAASSDSTIGDNFIPAKTTVIPNLYAVHMDPAKWDEPEVFRPERFLDEHGNVTGKDRVVTFSMGKRSCPGEIMGRQLVFLFSAGIIQNFDVRPPEGQSEATCIDAMAMVWKPTQLHVRMLERPR